MTSVGEIKAQHPRKARATSQTIERKPIPPKEASKMTQ